MKIAMINPFFMRGNGIDRVMWELAKIYVRKKHQVDIFCSEANLKAWGANIHVIPAKEIFGYKVFHLTLKIRKMLKGYDVINPHHSISQIFLVDKKTIPTYHGFQHWMLETGRNPIWTLGRQAILHTSGYAMHFAKKIIAISDYMAKYLMENYRISREKIEIIPNGVDLEKFTISTKDKGYMFFAGRHVKYKGIQDIIDVAKTTKFPLIIAGSGPYTPVLEEKVQNENLGDLVKFVGRVPDDVLVDLYRNCSFFVSGTKWEGFGLIFLEAMACGKPVIAYNMTANPEIVKSYFNGFCVNNIAEMNEKAGVLACDKKLRKKMGKQAYNFTTKNYNWDKVANQYLKLFESNSVKR